MSKVKEFKAALYAACQGAYASPTAVTYGHPLTAGSHTEIVAVRSVSTIIDPDSMGTSRPRREELTATVEVYVGSGGSDQQTVTERAADLADTLESYLLATDPTLSGAVVYAFVTAADLTETGENDEDELAAGRFARIVLTITARARY